MVILRFVSLIVFSLTCLPAFASTSGSDTDDSICARVQTLSSESGGSRTSSLGSDPDSYREKSDEDTPPSRSIRGDAADALTVHSDDETTELPELERSQEGAAQPDPSEGRPGVLTYFLDVAEVGATVIGVFHLNRIASRISDLLNLLDKEQGGLELSTRPNCPLRVLTPIDYETELGGESTASDETEVREYRGDLTDGDPAVHVVGGTVWGRAAREIKKWAHVIRQGAHANGDRMFACHDDSGAIDMRWSPKRQYRGQAAYDGPSVKNAKDMALSQAARRIRKWAEATPETAQVNEQQTFHCEDQHGVIIMQWYPQAQDPGVIQAKLQAKL